MSSNKEEMAVKAKRHEVDAFNDLYKAYYKTAMIKATGMAKGNAADAEELTADTMSKLPLFLEKWSPSKSTFATFFETCSRNAMINSIKRLKRKSTISIDEIQEPTAPDAPEDFDLNDLAGISTSGDIAISAIKSLSPSQREIVELVIQGKTIKEISRLIDATEQDVRARLKATVNYISFELRVNDPAGLDTVEGRAARE